MPIEVFRNLAETTLASGYTSGGASITVVSASGFPSTGTFRVRIGNAGQTIYRVDSVTGAVFTGGAEFNDANASGGDTVKIVASRQVAERFLQSPESSSISAPSGTSGTFLYGPLHRLTPVVGGDFAWVNQGTASVTDANGISYLVAPTVTTNVRLRQKVQPATPFTLTAMIVAWQTTDVNSEMGIMFRESSTDKMVGACVRDRQYVSVQRWSSVTAIGTTVFNRPNMLGLDRLWLRMTHDGTNIVSSYSLDGMTFVQIDSHAKTGSFTTDSNQIGYFVGQRGTGVDQAMSVLSWSES